MNNKCAIIISNNITKEQLEKYDLIIGVEKGSVHIESLNITNNIFHISDFDSITIEQKNKFKELDNAIILDHKKKDYSDGESALLLANEKGYYNDDIDIYVDFNHRQDHYMNMILVARKYGCNMISNNFNLIVIQPNVKKTISKIYDIVSGFIFEETHIKTNGLMWDINEVLNIETGTKFLSNEIINDSFTIYSNKKIIIKQLKK